MVTELHKQEACESNLRLFFSDLSEAYLGSDHTPWSQLYTLPFAIAYRDTVAVILNEEQLLEEMHLVRNILAKANARRIKFDLSVSSIRDGHLPVTVHYTLMTAMEKDISSFSATYFCEVKDDGAILITYQDCHKNRADLVSALD